MLYIAAFVFLGVGIAHIDDHSQQHLNLAYASFGAAALLLIVAVAIDYINSKFGGNGGL
jgi:hypothetical protein